jgi:hypothetical protein
LVVAAHGLASLNGTRGHFVTGRHQAAHGDAINAGAAHQLRARNHNIICRVEANK